MDERRAESPPDSSEAAPPLSNEALEAPRVVACRRIRSVTFCGPLGCRPLDTSIG